MSYTVSFYLVDIEKIKSTIGSKYVSIIDKIDIGEDYRKYLETLIMGTEQNPDNSSEYGYVFEKIVKHLFGENEEASAFEDLRYGEFDAPILSWIIKSGSPISLLSNEDFPFIGHRYLAEIQETLDEWDDDQYDNYEKYIGDMIEEMLEIFQIAVEQKKDIITFYY
jgi:hypothetical protein